MSQKKEREGGGKNANLAVKSLGHMVSFYKFLELELYQKFIRPRHLEFLTESFESFFNFCF